MQQPTLLKQILNTLIDDRDAIDTLIDYATLPNCFECDKNHGIRNCVICVRSYCNQCDGDLIKCELCNEDLCYNCWSQCTQCCEAVCPYCCDQCKLCGGICYKCITPNDDEIECSICHTNGYCNDCLSECQGCKEIMCDDCCGNRQHHLYCKVCLDKM